MIKENEGRLWGRHDNQHNDIQHNDTRHNNKYTATLSIRSVVMLSAIYAECRSCWVSQESPLCSVIMLNVIMLSVIMLNVVAPLQGFKDMYDNSMLRVIDK